MYTAYHTILLWVPYVNEISVHVEDNKVGRALFSVLSLLLLILPLALIFYLPVKGEI